MNVPQMQRGSSVSGTSDVIGVDDDSANTCDTGMELEPTSSSSSEISNGSSSEPTTNTGKSGGAEVEGKGEEDNNDFETSSAYSMEVDGSSVEEAPNYISHGAEVEDEEDLANCSQTKFIPTDSVIPTGLSDSSSAIIMNVDSDNAEEVMSTDKAAEVKSPTGLSVECVTELGRGKRTKIPVDRYDGNKQDPKIARFGTSGGSTSVVPKEIGLHNSNGNLCYINSMMRILFYATDGSLERLLKTITHHSSAPLDHFIQQLSSLWDFLRSEEKNTSRYCMKAYLTAFKELYTSRGLTKRNWEMQQDAEEYVNVFFELLFNNYRRPYMPDDGFHGIEEINGYTYTQCTKCSKIQPKGETTSPHHVVVISPDDGTNNKLSFKELLEYTMQGVTSVEPEQQCSRCVDEIKKKISSDNEAPDSTQTVKERIHAELEKLGYSRAMTHKMCWKIREDQDFILVLVKKQTNGERTRKMHFLLPQGDFAIKENGMWNVWAVLLYTGQGHGATAGGHYYVIDTKGKCDDEQVYYDKNLLSTLSAKGFHQDFTSDSTGNGYIEMVLLKRTVSGGDGSVCGEISRYMYM
jgi:hypothetical protein